MEKYLGKIELNETFYRSVVPFIFVGVFGGIFTAICYPFIRDNFFLLIFCNVIWIIPLTVFSIKFYDLLVSYDDNTQSDDDDRLVETSQCSITAADEAKILFEHLSDRHKLFFSHVDALDAKFAQVIALNGVILSFIFDKGADAASKALFGIGLFIILASVFIGLFGYISREFYTGASTKFFIKCDQFARGEGIKELKDQLILDIERNVKSHNTKAFIFDLMLILSVIGLLVLVVGYYYGQ